LIAMGDSHVEVDVGVGGRVRRFVRKRFIESMQRGDVLSIGIERQAEITIGFGIRRVHAECGASLSKCVLGVV